MFDVSMGQSHGFGMSGCMITSKVKFQHFLNFILYFEASLHWDIADLLALRHWKMSRVVMVITSEHIEFITSAEGTSDKINVSRVIP